MNIFKHLDFFVKSDNVCGFSLQWISIGDYYFFFIIIIIGYGWNQGLAVILQVRVKTDVCFFFLGILKRKSICYFDGVKM